MSSYCYNSGWWQVFSGENNNPPSHLLSVSSFHLLHPFTVFLSVFNLFSLNLQFSGSWTVDTTLWNTDESTRAASFKSIGRLPLKLYIRSQIHVCVHTCGECCTRTQQLIIRLTSSPRCVFVHIVVRVTLWHINKLYSQWLLPSLIPHHCTPSGWDTLLFKCLCVIHSMHRLP